MLVCGYCYKKRKNCSSQSFFRENETFYIFQYRHHMGEPKYWHVDLFLPNKWIKIRILTYWCNLCCYHFQRQMYDIMKSGKHAGLLWSLVCEWETRGQNLKNRSKRAYPSRLYTSHPPDMHRRSVLLSEEIGEWCAAQGSSFWFCCTVVSTRLHQGQVERKICFLSSPAPLSRGTLGLVFKLITISLELERAEDSLLEDEKVMFRPFGLLVQTNWNPAKLQMRISVFSL